MVSFAAQIELLDDLAKLAASGGLRPEETLERALALLAKRMGITRGAITLVDAASRKIRIRAAWGLAPEQMRRGEYLPGEGVTGKVIESGEAACIADAAREPLFLNRTRSRDLARERISFICVPIKLDGETVGALSADRAQAKNATHAGEASLEAELRLLGIVAAVLAPLATHAQDHGRENDAPPYGFVGASPVMRDLYAQIAQAAPAHATVFLQGESGTGKELAARAIHDGGPRKSGPFVSVNCAALPEQLAESELFGHERGAFTGAFQTRKGRFELACGGTLFLDEIGELSPLVQAKLLRVLQERSFERLGGARSLSADVRVIAATNRDLAEMTEKGLFRRDLFYRLNVFPIRLPPLREHPGDVPLLTDHFLRREARLARRPCPRVSLSAMTLLERHSWPGNVRELQNVMERAYLLAGSGGAILPAHLPEELRAASGREGTPLAPGELTERLEELEKTSIEKALAASCGHIGEAARALGLTRRALGLRLSRYGLCYKDFRAGKI